MTSTVTTIAHWILATRQILDDVPMLQSYVDGRLRYGLSYVEDNQILNGGGTGTDLNGIYTQATAFSAPFTIAAPTRIDVLRMALLNAFLAEYQPDGMVLNPTDWAAIELVKDSTGRHIIGNPKQEGTPSLWGKPVVETQAMTVDKFWSARSSWGPRSVRPRGRPCRGLDGGQRQLPQEPGHGARRKSAPPSAVYRPEAFRKGDFSDDITAATT
jgi:hypothetical protein